MKLDDPYINFIIVSSYRSDKSDLDNRISFQKLNDSLLLRDYIVIEISGDKPACLAYKECDNNELRYDAIEIMDLYKQEYVIVKYKGEEESRKVTFEGKETLLGVVGYQGDESKHNFYVEGLAFSFEERKRYWIPKNQSQIKNGMIVELLDNNGDWIEKEVVDSDLEYHRLYRLMIKYNKMRIAYKDV